MSSCYQILRQYKHISRAEKRSLDKHIAQNERKECAKDFYKFAKKVLDDGESQRGAEPAFDVGTAQSYFRNVYHSEHKEFHRPHWLPEAPSPSQPFEDRPFTLRDVEVVIRKARVRSSPSLLNQITYWVPVDVPHYSQPCWIC